jgi:hypothetical protein
MATINDDYSDAHALLTRGDSNDTSSNSFNHIRTKGAKPRLEWRHELSTAVRLRTTGLATTAMCATPSRPNATFRLNPTPLSGRREPHLGSLYPLAFGARIYVAPYPRRF